MIANFVETSYKNYNYNLTKEEYDLSVLSAKEENNVIVYSTVKVNAKESFLPNLSKDVKYHLFYSVNANSNTSVFNLLKLLNSENTSIAAVTADNKADLKGFEFSKTFKTRLYAQETNTGVIVAYKEYNFNQDKVYGSKWWVTFLIILSVIIVLGIIGFFIHKYLKESK